MLAAYFIIIYNDGSAANNTQSVNRRSLAIISFHSFNQTDQRGRGDELRAGIHYDGTFWSGHPQQLEFIRSLQIKTHETQKNQSVSYLTLRLLLNNQVQSLQKSGRHAIKVKRRKKPHNTAKGKLAENQTSYTTL